MASAVPSVIAVVILSVNNLFLIRTCRFSVMQAEFRGPFPMWLRVDCLLIFPQIAIAIGVLTSNKGGGRRTTLADWTWHQGAIAGCSGRGATAGCHRRVPL